MTIAGRGEPVTLAHEIMGDGPPLLLAHGLLGSGRNLRAVARALAPRFAVHLLDLRNHGSSPWAAPTTYDAMAVDLIAHMDRLGLARAAMLGHSMGGKAAMRAAMLAPERIDALTIVDIAPAARPQDAAFAGYVRAMAAADLAVTSRAAIEEQLKDAAPDPRVRAFLMTNLAAGEAGFRWRCNLGRLAVDLDAILDFPFDGARAYEGPVRFVLGGRSDYVAAEHRDVILRWFPNADHRVVAGAGHWPHADAPKAFLAALPAAWRG